jgi:hypothetical protein
MRTTCWSAVTKIFPSPMRHGVAHLSDGFYHAVELVILESRLQSGTSAENRRR